MPGESPVEAAHGALTEYLLGQPFAGRGVQRAQVRQATVAVAAAAPTMKQPSEREVESLLHLGGVQMMALPSQQDATNRLMHLV